MSSIDLSAIASPKRTAEARFGPRPKRHKTAVACTECRERKRKCDGRKPVCGACSKKTRSGQSCVFALEKIDMTQHTEYVVSLQDKIHQLESMLSEQDLFTARRQPKHHETHPDFDINGLPLSPLRPLGTSPVPGTVSLGYSVPSDAAGTGGAVAAETIDDLSTPIPWPMASTHTGAHLPFDELRRETLASTTDAVHCLDKRAHEDVSDEASESEAEVDGMGAIASTNANESGTGGSPALERAYFGPSSTLGFMKHIQDVLKPARATRAHKTTRHIPNHERSYPQKAQRTTFGHHKYFIPTRLLADALLASYWSHVHPIYPYLFKSAFNRCYQKLWSEPKASPSRASPTALLQTAPSIDDSEEYYSDEPVFFCILNLVFCLGAQYSSAVGPSERCETGNAFFQRAKEFINLDSLEDGGLVVVQALLLMGHYLQSTDKSSMCWNIIGLAIRVSQSIGLDVPVDCRYSLDRPVNQLEMEVRKRLWGGCILHDRVTSMMFGRPLMLPPTSVRDISLLEGIDDEELTTSATPGRQPHNRPSYIDFFVQAVRLVQIVGDVLDAVYGRGNRVARETKATAKALNGSQNSTSRLADQVKTGDMHEILQLDAALTQWRDELPDFLKMANHATKSPDGRTSPGPGNGSILARLPRELVTIFARQAKVLQARFLHMKILLYRPVLVVLLSNNGVSTTEYSSADPIQMVLQQSMLQKISKHCIQAAQDLTHLVYGSLMSGDVALPAWWYNVFYLYTTGTIFVAQRLCPPLTPTETDEQWQECWYKCLQGLHKYSEQSNAARKCFKVLDLIDKQLFGAKHQVPRSSNADLDSSDRANQRRQDPPNGQAAVLVAEENFLVDQIPHVPPGTNAFNFSLSLNAQDMAWLENIPFDPNVDIGSSLGEWFDDIELYNHTYAAT